MCPARPRSGTTSAAKSSGPTARFSFAAPATEIDRSDAPGFPADYRARFADAYLAELTAFVRACTGEGPPGPTLDEDRKAVAAGVAARASAVAGRPLAVGTDWPWP